MKMSWKHAVLVASAILAVIAVSAVFTVPNNHRPAYAGPVPAYYGPPSLPSVF
jgi:hypothetical protein